MILSPRSPHELGCAPVNFPSRGKAARGQFFQKVHRQRAENMWNPRMHKVKLLFVESIFCQVGPVFQRFLPPLPHFRRFVPQAPFSPSTFLSLSNLLKREREIGLGRGEYKQTLIHKSDPLSKKASTDFSVFHRSTCGNLWNPFYLLNNALTPVLGGIHGSTGCAACGLPTEPCFEGGTYI